MKINKSAYEKLVQDDIAAINKHIPDGVIKDHIKLIICDSIDFYYQNGKDKGAESEAESNWVSVEDRYPNENEEVIVYFEYKFEGRETETGVTSAIYETQNTLRHCFYQHNGSVVVGVVKWQHMPTP